MRLLIASFNVGAGHAQAAKAIQTALQLTHPEVESTLLDVLGCLPWAHRKLFSSFYLELIRMCPELWGLVFKRTDDPARWCHKNQGFLARLAHRRLLNQIAALDPDKIVCTHFMHLNLLFREYCGPRRMPLACVVTDFEAHGSWVHPQVSQYFVASERVRHSLARRGVPLDRVWASGIPIAPRFAQEMSRAHARARFSLSPDLPAVAVLGGGLGLGPMEQTMRELDQFPRRLQVIGAAGKNAALQKKLRALMLRQPAQVLGFLDNMHELLSAVDLIITKPGGLTSSEALARQCPMLLANPIPGQEAANADFLLEHGAAAKINRICDLNPVLEDLLAHRLPQMRDACAQLGKPRAAFEVAEALANPPGSRVNATVELARTG
jgi:processive 1,2-diacylglycerol beta-glucosyltransferase